ncbi:MAG: PHP domain-containing protein, partial [Bacteroidales bacterium]|nr:PHP domain-containing protein [Bacteroidales bacterium]
MYLNVHSYFSLRYGTLNIEELLALARQNGVEVMALTDINTTMGIPKFVKKAAETGIKPVAGV